MSSQPGLSFTEPFTNISNATTWPNNFTTGSEGSIRWKGVATNSGTIPCGTCISTATTTFVTGSSGGVQRGSANIQLLSTGTGSNSTSAAIDFFMDFTGVNAGTLSFDAATVFNSTGDRPGSLKVYWSTDGTTFTELTGTNLPYVATNNVTGSATISAIALPSAFNGSATARLRFYYHNANTGTTGSRPKISIDNVTVTATAAASITTTVAGFGPFCNNTSNAVSVAYTSSGSFTGTFTAELSNSSGSFASGTTNIGTGSSPISASIPSGTTAGTLYRIRVVNSAPVISGTDNGSNITLSSPPSLSSISAATPVCAGSNLTLSGTASGGTYSWSGPTGSGLGTTVPLTISAPSGGSGIYTVTAINGACTVTATTPSVTVVAPPTAVSATVSPTAVCSGNTISLSGSATGASSYSWSGPGSYSSTALNPAAFTTSTVSAGIYTLTAISGICSVTATTASLTVNPLPSPTISGSTTISSGGSATLTFTGISGDVVNYTWTGGGSSSATVSGGGTITASVSPTITTTYSVTGATSVHGCTQSISGQFATITISTGSPTDTIPTRDNNMAMGNPSAATTVTSNVNNYLMVKSQYALSYNDTKGMANWVSWHLSRAWKDTAARCDCFTQDATLPGGYYAATTSNYSGTGFDRGHLCPSDDRDGSDTDNAATFKMTNISPQAPELNQIPWGALENYCRNLIYNGNELYIIAGGYGTGGTGSLGGTTNTIASGNINVPSHFWKVIVVLPVGVNDVTRVTTATRVIAVDMPNTQNADDHPWTYYRTSVDSIEARTGYDFLSSVSTGIQAVVEAGVDNGPATLVAWDFTGFNADVSVAATTFDSSLNTAMNTITRGSGAAASAGASSFRTTGFSDNGISTSNTDYFQTTIQADAGYKVSLSTIDATLSGTSSYCQSPGVTSQFAYSLNGTSFTLINSPITTVGTNATISTVNISGISALQNVTSATTIYLRYYASGQTTTGGWGFYSAYSGSNALSIGGTVTIDAGCVSAPTTVSANAAPNPVCSGSSLTLTGNATGATSFSWSGPNSFSSTLQNPAAFTTSTLSAGIYTFTATNTCGSTIVSTSSVTVTTTPTSVSASSTPNPVCSGSTVSLTGNATGATSYSWSGPNSFSSALQNPTPFTTSTLSAGIYTFTATNSCGNTVTTTPSLTIVNPVSGIAANATPNPVCTSAALTLTGSATGATSYSWAGPNSFSSTGQNPAAFTTGSLSAGIYSFTATNICGSVTATTSSVIVNTPPTSVTAAATPNPLCSGSSLTLTGNATGATSYSWSGPNSFSSSLQNPTPFTVSSLSAGIYTFTATNACGNTTASTSSVTITPTPTSVSASITPNPVCSGSTVTLTGNATGAVSYSWAGPNSFSSALQNPTPFTTSTLSAGVYTFTATNTCGNTVATTSAVTVVSPVSGTAANASPNPLCSGAAVTLTGSATGATSYSWSGPNSFSSTLQNPASFTVSSLSAGIYSFTATNICGGVTAVTSSVTVNAAPTSVTATATPSAVCNGASLTLTSSATGATTFSWTGPNSFSSTSQNPTAFTAGSLSAGVYSLTASSGSCSVTAFTSSVTVSPLPTATISGTTTIFSGSPATLVFSGASGTVVYYWNGSTTTTTTITGSGSSSVSVTPTVTTTYTLTSATSAAGCSQSISGSATITVSATPVPLIGWDVSTTPGGSNNFGASPFTHSTLATNLTVTAELTRGAGVTVSGTGASRGWGGTGFNSSDSVVAVTAGKYASFGFRADTGYIISLASYTINYRRSGTGALKGSLEYSLDGTNYTWIGGISYTSSSSSGATISNIDLSTVSALQNISHATPVSFRLVNYAASSATGTWYIFDVANSTADDLVFKGIVNCASAPTAVTANVSSAALCTGSSLTLTGSGFIATSYSWSGPGSYASTLQNPVLTGSTVATGVYTLTATNACGSTMATTTPVTVYSVPTAAITSAISPCMGYSATVQFTGTPSANITYRIDGGSNLTAALDASTGVYALATGALTATHTYSLVNAYNPGCTTVIGTTTTLTPIPMQWVGGSGTGTESNWNTAGNWSCGFIPGISDDVTIPSGTTFSPALAVSGSASVSNLTIASGATLNINSGASMNIKGNLNNAGTITGAGTAKLNGSALQNITGIGSVKELELNNTNGASINTAARVTVLRQLTINSGTLSTSDSLVLASSDTTSSARIAAIAHGSAITGKIQIQQYVQGGYRRFRFMSHPFNSAISLGQLQNTIDITGTPGADSGFVATGSNAPSAFRYDPYTANSNLSYDPGWKPFTSITPAVADSNKFNRYQGIRIFLRGAKGEGLGYWFSYIPSPTVIKMAGFINQGDQSITLYKGSGTVTGTPVQEYNMVGNPYPSPIDIGTVAHNALVSGDIVGAAFYVWNPSLGASGQYQAIPINTVSAAPYYVQANTAFQVRADHDHAALHFTENDKGSTATSYLFKLQPDVVSLYVYDANYHPWDMLHIKFSDAATEGEDKYLDATKPAGADFNLYSLSAHSRKMAIDARPYAVDKVIPLGISSAYMQEFIIKAENIPANGNEKIYLHDKLLRKYIPLQQGTEYRFTITKDKTSQGDNRFEISMKPAEQTTTTNDLHVTMTPNPATDEVNIRFVSDKAENVAVNVLDMSGISVYNKNLGVHANGTINIPLNKLASGIYLAELTSGDQKVVKRLIKE